MDKKFFKKKALFPLLVFILVLLIIELRAVLNIFFPTEALREWMTRTLEQEISVQIAMDEIQLHVFPRPSVRIMNVTLTDPINGHAWVRADSLEIKLKLSSLLQGKALPYKMTLKHPTIQVQRDFHGAWLFMPLPQSWRHEKEHQGSDPLSGITMESIIIKDASVEVLDQRAPSRGPSLILQELDVHVQGIAGAAPIRVKVNGHFPRKLFELNSLYIQGTLSQAPGYSDLKHLKVDADLAISHMPVEVVRSYFQEFLDLQLFSGEMDLKAHCSFIPDQELDMSGELMLNNYLLVIPQYATRPLTGESAVLNFDLTRAEEAISVRHLSLGFGEASIWGHGIWTQNLHGKPWYGISMHASNLSFEEIQGFLPDKLLPSKVIHALQHATSSGNLDIPLLEITKGDYRPPGETETRNIRRTTVKIAFHNFGLNTESDFLSLESVNGELYIYPESIQLWDLRGNYGRSRVDYVGGMLSRIPGGTTHFEIDARVNLMEAQHLVHQLPEDFRTIMPFSEILQARGYAHISAGFSSSSLAEIPVTIDGTMDLIAAGFSFPFSPFVFTGIQGRLTFKENNALPFTLKAKIDQLPADINGEVHGLFGVDPHFFLRVHAGPTEKEFVNWFPVLEGFLTLGDESPSFTLLLDGTPDEMKFNASLDLTRTTLTAPDWLTKKKGISSSLELTGLSRKGEEMIVQLGRLELAGQSLLFSGSIQGKEEVLHTFEVKSDALSLQPLAEIFPMISGSPSGSTLSVALSLSYQPQKKGTLKMDGKILMDQMLIRPRFSHWPLKNLSGMLNFAGNEISASEVKCEWGDFPFTFGFTLPLHDTSPSVFRIDAPFLNINSLLNEIAAKEGDRFRDNEKVMKQRWFQGELNLTRVIFEPLELQDFRANMVMKDGLFTISSFTTSGLDGRADGKGWIDFRSGEGPLFNAESVISKVSAEKYLQLFPHNRTFYAGKISGSIGVRGLLYPNLLESARKMSGEAHLKIQSTEERNYLFNLINTVISRVEIMMGKKDELFRILEYDEMGGDFIIRDGKFHTTNFYIDQHHTFDVSGITLDKLTAAVPMRIKYNVQAAGSFDFLDTNIDCFIMAQPFSMTTKIVKNIPIAGKVLTGKDESLYSVYFRYRGFIRYTYRGTEQSAKLDRVDFEDLPEDFKGHLKP